MKLTSFSNLKIAKLIPRKVTNCFAAVQTSNLHWKDEKSSSELHYRSWWHKLQILSVKIPFQGHLSSLPLIYWKNSKDTLCQHWTAPFPFCWVGRRKWDKVTVTNQLSHLPPASTPSMCNYSLFLLLLYSSFCSWDRSNFVLGGDREGALPRKNHDFHHSLTPTGLNQSSHIGCFPTSLPGWGRQKQCNEDKYLQRHCTASCKFL